MENIKIDIIIPCYNSHKTIDRCLGSILSQRILPSIKVTLVKDGGKNYRDVIRRYSPIMNIQEIGYNKNSGPADARNYGLLNTEEELIMFMDSDDALANPFAVANLVNEMYSNPNNVIIISNFAEELAPLQIKIHKKDTSFMHGKLYKRSYLKKHNILQKPGSRCNEDVGFNILTILSAENNEIIKFADCLTYFWLYNPSSIVRNDKKVYDNSISYKGFAENLTYVFEELEKNGKDKTHRILLEKITTMERLYLLYKEKSAKCPEFEADNKTALINFYNKIYKYIKDEVTDELFTEIYNNLPFKNIKKEEVKAFINSLNH